MYNTIYKIRYICNHENRIICLSYDYILDDCWIFASLPPWRPLSCAGGGGRGGGSAGDHSWHQVVTAELLRSHCWVMSVGTRRRCWRSKQGGFYRNIREDPLPVWGRGHGGCTGWGGLAAAGQELSDNTLPLPPAEYTLSTNMISIILQSNISYNQTIRH